MPYIDKQWARLVDDLSPEGFSKLCPDEETARRLLAAYSQDLPPKERRVAIDYCLWVFRRIIRDMAACLSQWFSGQADAIPVAGRVQITRVVQDSGLSPFPLPPRTERYWLSYAEGMVLVGIITTPNWVLNYDQGISCLVLQAKLLGEAVAFSA